MFFNLATTDRAIFPTVAKNATVEVKGSVPVVANFATTAADGTVYHIGASLKDLGKKLFAFSRMEMKETELFALI
jgi:hypothetical protein